MIRQVVKNVLRQTVRSEGQWSQRREKLPLETLQEKFRLFEEEMNLARELKKGPLRWNGKMRNVRQKLSSKSNPTALISEKAKTQSSRYITQASALFPEVKTPLPNTSSENETKKAKPVVKQQNEHNQLKLSDSKKGRVIRDQFSSKPRSLPLVTEVPAIFINDMKLKKSDKLSLNVAETKSVASEKTKLKSASLNNIAQTSPLFSEPMARSNTKSANASKEIKLEAKQQDVNTLSNQRRSTGQEKLRIVEQKVSSKTPHTTLVTKEMPAISQNNMKSQKSNIECVLFNKAETKGVVSEKTKLESSKNIAQASSLFSGSATLPKTKVENTVENNKSMFDEQDLFSYRKRLRIVDNRKGRAIKQKMSNRPRPMPIVNKETSSIFINKMKLNKSDKCILFYKAETKGVICEKKKIKSIIQNITKASDLFPESAPLPKTTFTNLNKGIKSEAKDVKPENVYSYRKGLSPVDKVLKKGISTNLGDYDTSTKGSNVWGKKSGETLIIASRLIPNDSLLSGLSVHYDMINRSKKPFTCNLRQASTNAAVSTSGQNHQTMKVNQQPPTVAGDLFRVETAAATAENSFDNSQFAKTKDFSSTRDTVTISSARGTVSTKPSSRIPNESEDNLTHKTMLSKESLPIPQMAVIRKHNQRFKNNSPPPTESPLVSVSKISGDCNNFKFRPQ